MKVMISIAVRGHGCGQGILSLQDFRERPGTKLATEERREHRDHDLPTKAQPTVSRELQTTEHGKKANVAAC